MVLNPCWCCCEISLQTGTKIIAFLQILSCTFTLVTGILGLTRVVELKQDPDKPWFETDPLDPTVLTVLWSIVLVIGVIGLILAIILFQGARKKERGKLFTWFFIRCIVMALMFSKFIYDCIHVRGDGVKHLIGASVGIVFDAYCTFVVWCFWKEVKAGESDGTV